MLSFDPPPPQMPPRWSQPFEKLRLWDDDLALTGPTAEAELARGPGDSLLLLDYHRGMLWQIDRDGRAEPLRQLWGLPRELSLPGLDQHDRITLFAADSPRLAPPDPADAGPALRTGFPAFVLLRADEPGRLEFIEADRMRSFGSGSLLSMRLQQLEPLPDRTGWFGYDAASGEILRIVRR